MFLVKEIYSQCPICIVTVGGGMILAKKFGVDDLMVSLWIAALNAAIALWLAPKFKIKLLKNPYFLTILFLALTLIYFQTTNQLGSITNTFLGINKVIFGQVLGTLLILIGSYIDKITRINNNGKVLFYYQKVIFPIGLLIIFTLIFKFIFNL